MFFSVTVSQFCPSLIFPGKVKAYLGGIGVHRINDRVLVLAANIIIYKNFVMKVINYSFNVEKFIKNVALIVQSLNKYFR